MKKNKVLSFLFVLPLLMSAGNSGNYTSTITGESYSNEYVKAYQKNNYSGTATSNMGSKVMDVYFSYEYFKMGYYEMYTNGSENTYCVLYKVKIIPGKNIKRKWGFLNLEKKTYDSATISSINVQLSFSNNLPENFNVIYDCLEEYVNFKPITYYYSINEKYAHSAISHVSSNGGYRIGIYDFLDDFKNYTFTKENDSKVLFARGSSDNTNGVVSNCAIYDNIYSNVSNRFITYQSETTLFGAIAFQCDTMPQNGTLSFSAKCGLIYNLEKDVEKKDETFYSDRFQFAKVTYKNQAEYTVSNNFTLSKF